MAGGFLADFSSGALASVEIYDPAAGAAAQWFTLGAELQTGRFSQQGLNILGLDDTRVLFLGGDSSPRSGEILSIQPALHADEGTTVTLTAPVFDPGVDDILSYMWTVEGLPDSGTDPTFDFTQPGDGTFAVQAVIADEDGGTITRHFQVVFENAVPTAELLETPAPFHGLEGEPVSLTLNALDTGSTDTHTFDWELFDPSGNSVATGSADTVAPGIQFTSNESGSHTLEVTVTDNAGASSSVSVPVLIGNVAPVVTFDTPPVAGTAAIAPTATASALADPTPEGSIFTFTGQVEDVEGDRSGHRATVDFGDGTVLPVILGADGNFSVSHIYADDRVDDADDGIYEISLEVRDGEEIGTITDTVTVTNVAPQPVLNPVFGALAGVETHITGAVIDPGGPSDVAVAIDFGEGTPDPQALVLNANGTFDIVHIYASAGLYTVTLSAKDEGPAVEETLVITVGAAPLTAVDDQYAVNEDANLSVSDPLAGVLANDEGALTATLVIGPQHGELILSPDGTFDYTPAANFNGIDTFTYRVANDALADHEGLVELSVSALDDDLRVLDVTPNASGFVVRFDGPFDPSVLNLYQAESPTDSPASLSLADLVLIGANAGSGATPGEVRGSLIVGNNQVTFVATGGVLAPDDYTLTLRSGANGFITPEGDLLDGNADGTPGDDFTHGFAIAPSAARVVSLPDFARGPGQTVDFPAGGTEFGITIDDAAGVEGIDLTIVYDPTLLTITGATRGADAPGDAVVLLNPATPGVAIIVMAFPTVPTVPTVIGGGAPAELVRLTASVPSGAPYGAKHVLDITELLINEGNISALGDNAIHVVAYLGDTTGNGDYSSLDGQRILRLAVGADSGLGAYPLADPVIVADITGNGTTSALDATKILRVALQIPQSEVPALPNPLPSITLAGLDPTVSAAQDLAANLGETVTVPISVDTIPAGLDSVQLRLTYDPATLEVLDVVPGSVTSGFSLFAARTDVPGVVSIDASNGGLVAARDGGTLANLTLRIRADATPGDTTLDVQDVRLNDGRYTLVPLPQPGPDGSDGRIAVRAPAVSARVGIQSIVSDDEVLAPQSDGLDLESSRVTPLPPRSTTPNQPRGAELRNAVDTAAQVNSGDLSSRLALGRADDSGSNLERRGLFNRLVSRFKPAPAAPGVPRIDADRQPSDSVDRALAGAAQPLSSTTSVSRTHALDTRVRAADLESTLALAEMSTQRNGVLAPTEPSGRADDGATHPSLNLKMARLKAAAAAAGSVEERRRMILLGDASGAAQSENGDGTGGESPAAATPTDNGSPSRLLRWLTDYEAVTQPEVRAPTVTLSP